MAKIAKPTSSLLPALSRALSRFFAWWGGELAALLPPSLRLWWREADRIVLLSFDDGRARFERVAAGRREEIHAVDTDTPQTPGNRGEIAARLRQLAGKRFRLMLCLPPEQVLRRIVVLPLAVEQNLRQSLSFELDRYTPFRPEQAYFDFLVTARDAAQNRLTVDLAAVPKPAVDDGVARALALGLSADGAVLAEELLRQGGDCRNFLPANTLRRATGTTAWRRLGAAGLAAALLGVFLAVPIWQKRAAAISLLAPLAEAKAAAQETDAARDRLRKLVEEHNFLHDRKWNLPSTLLVLQELSKLLPDDTYVMQLEMDGASVQIQGDTGSATSLVETLEASPVFKDVGFKSQLTKLQGTPYDRFHLSATYEAAAKPVRPAAAPAGEAPAATAPAVPAAPAAAAAATAPAPAASAAATPASAAETPFAAPRPGANPPPLPATAAPGTASAAPPPVLPAAGPVAPPSRIPPVPPQLPSSTRPESKP